jgi:replicative DNA helicase
MVTEKDRAVLDDRLRWEQHRRLRITPEYPEVIYEAAVGVEATVVVLDSIKDLVAKIATDESGQAYNDAVQICVANGVEVIALHHTRKATSEGRGALSLDDVYGSTWITAGAGSVIALNGRAGEGIARFRHLKMPAEEVGPFDVEFDYDAGTVSTIGRRDLVAWFAEVGTASTAEATRYLFGKADATEAEKRKARRKLGRMETDGCLTRSGERGAMTVWTWVGRSGVGQGGRSATRSGSVAETGNPYTTTAGGVGQGNGQGRSGGSVTLPLSREGAMTTPAATKRGKNKVDDLPDPFAAPAQRGNLR